MEVTSAQVEAGQAVYTKRTLAAYDLVVLGVSNHWIWKCPTARLLAHYNQYVTANHLDVRDGSGYFLDRCTFPTDAPRVALMDFNEHALEYAARRIARLEPEIYRHNMLEPIALLADKFDSIAMNYLLHCLPGTIESKSVVFDHLRGLLNSGGVLFGATLLQGGVRRSWTARRLMAAYSRRGIFSNTNDNLDGLTRALRNRFANVTIDIVGCAALFAGRIR